PISAARPTEPIDQSQLLALADVVREATEAFEAFDHTKALEVTEKFFWNFTDDYLELVKERAYGQGGATPESQASAVFTLRLSLHVMLQLLAPFLPFTTEEIWSWWQKEAGSIHRSSWPQAVEVSAELDAGNHGLIELAANALTTIRKAKSDSKASMKAEIETATIEAPAAVLSSLRLFESDLKAVGRIRDLAYEEATEVAVSNIVLAEVAE
ncbi:MAG: class I tRNA ligase family protein, partial [Actinomycetes bacterium]